MFTGRAIARYRLAMGFNLCECGARKKYTAERCRVCSMATQPLPNEMSDAEVAWLAGILEGEGCWSNNTHENWHLQVTMTDEDVVNRIAVMTGVGRVYKQERGHGRWKTCFRWQVSVKVQREALTRLVWPWLGQRRRAKVLALWPEVQHVVVV